MPRRLLTTAMSTVEKPPAGLGARPQAQPGRAPQAREGAARDPRRAARADRRRLRERRRGGRRPAPVVGPLPRQAEDRDVHAPRQGAGRAALARASCARSARPRTCTAAATASSRPARTSSCTGSSSRSCPTSSPTSRPPGMTTAGGCGDTVRNITGCPVQGIAADELFDATPIVDAAADLFYGNPDWANLPRKHKYSIAACADRCNAPEINCISLIGTVPRGPRGLRRARRRRALVGAADRARHGRLRPEGGRERDPRRDHERLVGGPRVPRLAREGAAQVHGRRHRPRGHPRARRGAARPQARGLHAAADRPSSRRTTSASTRSGRTGLIYIGVPGAPRADLAATR